MEGLKVINPQGAMYVMVGLDIARFEGVDNDMAFCEQVRGWE